MGKLIRGSIFCACGCVKALRVIKRSGTADTAFEAFGFEGVLYYSLTFELSKSADSGRGRGEKTFFRKKSFSPDN